MSDFLTDFGKLGTNISSAFSPWGSMLSGIGTIIGSGQGIGNSIKSLFGSKSAMRRQLKNQKELMQYSANIQDEMLKKQNQMNLDNWNLQNAYNTPAAELQRIKDAGLNSNLIYGAQGLEAGNAGDVGSVSGVSLNSNSSYNPSSDVMQRQADLAFYKQAKEIGVLDSQIELNNAAANKQNAEANEVSSNAESLRNLQSSMMELYEQQKRQTESYRKFFDRTMLQRIESLNVQLDLDRQQRQLMTNNIAGSFITLRKLGLERDILQYQLNEVLPNEVKESKTRQGLNNAQAINYRTNSMYLGAMATYVNMQTFGLQTDIGWKRTLYGSPTYKHSIVMQEYNKNKAYYYDWQLKSAELPFTQRGFNTNGGMWTPLSILMERFQPRNNHFGPNLY